MPIMKRLTKVLCALCILFSACKQNDDTKPIEDPIIRLLSVSPSAARGGDTIVIHGLNLPSDISLTLNNEKISILSVSKDSVIAIVPSMAGSGDILATVKGKDYTTKFTYNYVATVTTIAGTGSKGKQDGEGKNATFWYPAGLAADGSSIYVADSYNRLIRVIDTRSNEVTTIPIPGYDFSSPYMIAADTVSHNLYLTDFNENIIRLNKDGVKKHLYKGEMPIGGIAIGPDHYLYFANQYANKVYRLDTLTGTATLITSEILSPCSMMFDSTGALWVSGQYLYKYTLDGKITQHTKDKVFSGWTTAFDKRGNFYHANYTDNKIEMIEHSTGRSIILTGSGEMSDVDGEGLNASFNSPVGLAVDSWGVLYVSTYNIDANTGNKIRKILVK